LGKRFAALLIDFLLFCALFFPITRIVKGVWIMSASEHQWGYGWFITDPLCIIFLIIIILYFILLEGFFGATLGKRIMRLRVIASDGSRPGLRRSAIRNILRVIDALPALNILGVILILRSPEKARFGDRTAGTRVIDIHPARRYHLT